MRPVDSPGWGPRSNPPRDGGVTPPSGCNQGQEAAPAGTPTPIAHNSGPASLSPHGGSAGYPCDDVKERKERSDLIRRWRGWVWGRGPRASHGDGHPPSGFRPCRRWHPLCTETRAARGRIYGQGSARGLAGWSGARMGRIFNGGRGGGPCGWVGPGSGRTAQRPSYQS